MDIDKAVAVENADIQELVEQLNSETPHLVLEKEGKPVAMLLSVEEYQSLQAAKVREERETEERLRRFQQNARAIGEQFEHLGITEEQVEQQLEEVRQQLFEERYGNQFDK